MWRLIFVLICCCVFTNVNAENILCQQHHCIAVIDAGSTGSRLHIYIYDLDNNKNPIEIREHWSKKIKPGIATLTPKQPIIDAYLNQLFQGSPAQHMPVYFYATAGMRLLPESKQRPYYQALKKWFSQQKNWQLIDSKTITGTEEGVFGWLAINYKMGNFSSGGKSLVNVMDTGGASVQITFPVESVEKINRQDLAEIDVYGRHVTLFAHSFLGLGQTLLSQQFLNTENCFAYGYKLPNGSMGNGDALVCQQKIAKLMEEVYGVGKIVKPALANSAAHSWYAMGAIVSLLEGKPLHFENQQFTNQGLLEQANNEACHRQWSDLSAENPNNEYLYGTCLFSSYFYSLMVNGYGILPEETIHYIPSKEGLDWSLGVIIHQPRYA